MRPTSLILVSVFGAATFTVNAGAQSAVNQWPPHSKDRPRPPVMTPASLVTTPPPPDAVVLFGGTTLDAWTSSAQNRPVRWRIVDGAMEVVAGTGGIQTRDGFGDVQLHVEWMAPTPVRGNDQDRGNSGVFFMGMYEVQVLDSWENVTYADGQAAALYGQHPPLVNASRRPGEWQSYDIVFRRPRFDANGKVTSPARVTVLHNGVLVQDNVELTGPTGHYQRPPYAVHADKLPISIQDHGHPVRFRNMWVRRLEN